MGLEIPQKLHTHILLLFGQSGRFLEKTDLKICLYLTRFRTYSKESTILLCLSKKQVTFFFFLNTQLPEVVISPRVETLVSKFKRNIWEKIN